MSQFASDFRSFLLDQTAIAAAVGTHVHVGSVPQPTAPPYIWIGRAGVSSERTLDQAQGTAPDEERWDLEVWSDDVGEVQDLAELIRSLDCAKGVFGDGTIQLLVVEDHADDYVPKGNFGDEGYDLAAFQIQVLMYSAGTSSSSP